MILAIGIPLCSMPDSPFSKSHPRYHLWHGNFRHHRRSSPRDILPGPVTRVIHLHELVLSRGLGRRLRHNSTWDMGFPARNVPHAVKDRHQQKGHEADITGKHKQLGQSLHEAYPQHRDGFFQGRL